jgi:hypothetical protein
MSLWASSNANANLISNGDFESGLDGWDHNEYVQAWFDAANNNNVASLMDTGVMWQSFSTQAWMHYMLTFSYQAAPDSAANQFVNVIIFDAVDSGTQLWAGDIEVTNASEWMSYSTMFQAMSDTSVVRFSYNPTQSATSTPSITSTPPTTSSVLIDNVQVAQVDEPLPVFLTSLGLLVLMFKRKYAAKK